MCTAGIRLKFEQTNCARSAAEIREGTDCRGLHEISSRFGSDIMKTQVNKRREKKKIGMKIGIEVFKT